MTEQIKDHNFTGFYTFKNPESFSQLLNLSARDWKSIFAHLSPPASHLSANSYFVQRIK